MLTAADHSPGSVETCCLSAERGKGSVQSSAPREASVRNTGKTGTCPDKGPGKAQPGVRGSSDGGWQPQQRGPRATARGAGRQNHVNTGGHLPSFSTSSGSSRSRQRLLWGQEMTRSQIRHRTWGWSGHAPPTLGYEKTQVTGKNAEGGLRSPRGVTAQGKVAG